MRHLGYKRFMLVARDTRQPCRLLIETAQSGPMLSRAAFRKALFGQFFLIEIKARSRHLLLAIETVAQRQDWRSTIVNRLRARIYLRDKPVYR